MDVLVQHPSEIRRVSSCEHGWANDKLDSGMRKCNLMEDVGSKLVDDLVMLLPLPKDECDDYCHSLEEPEDVKASQPETLNNVIQTCSEEDAMASNMEVDGASNMEEDVYNIEKPLGPAHPISLLIPVAAEITSAMKGSRQRQCLETKTLSVSWAPDVYDPPVTSRCHSVKSKPHKHSRHQKKSSIKSIRKVKK
ncbi:hypothetical protein Leryth_009560 [Lithospermum erythrorhizon]|nr:hypothetical protein Leryth_009560 [Lithospermum erythrorhizon]